MGTVWCYQETKISPEVRKEQKEFILEELNDAWYLSLQEFMEKREGLFSCPVNALDKEIWGMFESMYHHFRDLRQDKDFYEGVLNEDPEILDSFCEPWEDGDEYEIYCNGRLYVPMHKEAFQLTGPSIDAETEWSSPEELFETLKDYDQNEIIFNGIKGLSLELKSWVKDFFKNNDKLLAYENE